MRFQLSPENQILTHPLKRWAKLGRGYEAEAGRCQLSGVRGAKSGRVRGIVAPELRSAWTGGDAGPHTSPSIRESDNQASGLGAGADTPAEKASQPGAPWLWQAVKAFSQL